MLHSPGFATLNERKAMALLRSSHLFKGFSEMEYERLLQRFTFHTLKPEEKLVQQGDAGDTFFFVLDGLIHMTRTEGQNEFLVATLTTGDFFGEGSLLTGRRRRATATAGSATILLSMSREGFDWMVHDYPQIRRELLAVTAGYDLANRKHFEWLAEGEAIHLVTHTHIAMLFLSLAPVAAAIIASLALGYYAYTIDIPILEVAAGILTALSIGWGALRWLDWSNDYFIVTDKRVAWLEEVLLLYQSLQEASLTEIRSVDVEANFFQRVIGFGDLNVRTYTGSIPMRNIGQPEQFKALIEEYWQRALKTAGQESSASIDRRLRERIGMEVKPVKTVLKRPVNPATGEAEVLAAKPGAFEKIFTNFFKVRFEVGDTVTYRKHWFVLLTKTFRPLLSLIVVLYPGTLLGLRLESSTYWIVYYLALLGLVGWWIYEYWDWRDDIYQVSSRALSDLERKPLGREVKKSAPLESVLSLEHERSGLIGILLNFGRVTINVGDTTFDFFGVHDPASVRQEISHRQQERLKQVELDRVSHEQDRMLDWLERYHRNTRELWERPEPTEADEEDKFRLK